MHRNAEQDESYKTLEHRQQKGQAKLCNLMAAQPIAKWDQLRVVAKETSPGQATWLPQNVDVDLSLCMAPTPA